MQNSIRETNSINWLSAPLRVKLTASAQVLELGKSLALDCSVSGFPIHQVVFRHNQNIIKSIGGSSLTSQQQHEQLRADYFVLDSAKTNRSQQLVGGQQEQATTTNEQLDEWPLKEQTLSHLIVILLEPQHAGAYQCFALNQFESAHSSTYIRVLDDPPRFKETFESRVFEERQDVSLQCSARANPLPEITWSIDEQPIPESSRLRFGDFVTRVSIGCCCCSS